MERGESSLEEFQTANKRGDWVVVDLTTPLTWPLRLKQRHLECGHIPQHTRERFRVENDFVISNNKIIIVQIYEKF